MLEPYRGASAPPEEQTVTVWPKLMSWTGRVWRTSPDSGLVLLKLDASLGLTELDNDNLRNLLNPFAAELSSFRLYLDQGAENRLPLSWAVGAFYVGHDNHTFARFYEFLGSPAAPVLIPLLPCGRSSVRSRHPHRSLQRRTRAISLRHHRLRSRLP
jgi:hypothetical protein